MDEIERTIRICLNKQSIDEGEGLPTLLLLFEYQAEMYKKNGLFLLAFAIYLDCVDLSARLLGFSDKLTLKMLNFVTSLMRSLKLFDMAEEYINNLCLKIESSLLKNEKNKVVFLIQENNE
jgi:hypothetical protein